MPFIDPLIELVAEREGRTEGVERGERVVVVLCDCIAVTDGLPLLLAMEAVPVNVYTPDGVQRADALAIPVLVAMVVRDAVPLTDAHDVPLTLLEELGHTEGDTEMEFVAEEVNVIMPDVDTVGDEVAEAVVDNEPQAVLEAVPVLMPLVLALAVEVANELLVLLVLGEEEVETEEVGDAVPTLDTEARVLGEGFEDKE